MIKRIFALLYARNLEFIRDRSTLAWNLLFPILMVVGMAVIFSGEEKPLFKVALYKSDITANAAHPFLDISHIDFFTVDDLQASIAKVERHQIDLLIEIKPDESNYWVNPESTNGYIIEKLLLATSAVQWQRHIADGPQIRYVDWLVPGILSMNMMFSCLFGIGYVIVHYRKNGYLKRLSATPTNALEFLTAQIGSRLLLTMTTLTLLYSGTKIFIGFPMHGQYIHLLLVALLGAFSMASMGLMFSARISSQELISGLINLVIWPMMLLSGVWFSLDGAPGFLKVIAECLPLTHIIDAARGIMIDGADLSDISYHLGILAIMSIVFLTAGASMFKWTED